MTELEPSQIQLVKDGLEEMGVYIQLELAECKSDVVEKVLKRNLRRVELVQRIFKDAMKVTVE